jgi:hypothetical protein
MLTVVFILYCKKYTSTCLSNMSYSRISDIPPHSPEASLPIRPVHSSTPTRKTGPKTCNQPLTILNINFQSIRWYRFLSGSFWPIQFRSRCLILGHAHCYICSLLQEVHLHLFYLFDLSDVGRNL